MDSRGQLGAETAVGAKDIIITLNSFPLSQGSPGPLSVTKGNGLNLV